MIKILAILLLFCTAASAQVPLTGAGRGTPGAGGPPTYFFNTAGSDAGDCTTTALSGTHSACVTITKLNTLTIAAGATVSFNGGNSFSTTTGAQPALSGNVTFTSYGTGNATISGTTAATCFNITSPPGSVTIQNLTCTGGTTSGSTTPHNGIQILNSTGANLTAGVTITGMTVSGYGFDCIGILSNPNGFNNVSITNNTVHDCGEDAATNPNGNGQGIDFTTGSTTSLTIFNNVTVSGNTIYNVLGTTAVYSGTGIGINGTTTFTIANNVIHDGGVNNTSTSGPDGIVTALSTGGTIQGNEVYNYATGSGGYDGGGIDFDWSTQNTIVQNNYLHDNAGYGFSGIQFTNSGNPNWQNNTYRFNVLQNNGNGPSNNVNGINFGVISGTMSGCAIYNNTVFQGNASPSIATSNTGGTLTCTISNNIFYNPSWFTTPVAVSFPSLSGLTLTFTGNDYWDPGLNYNWGGTTYTTFAAWQTASGQEKIPLTTGSNVGLTVQPTLTLAGGAGIIGTGSLPGTLGQQYALQSTSSLVSAGQNLNSLYGYTLPSTDFFGNAITATTLPVGAGKSGSATITLVNVGLTNFGTTSESTISAVPAGALFIVQVFGAVANRTIVTPTVTGCTLSSAIQNTTTAALKNVALFYCVPGSGIASGVSVSNTNADSITSLWWSTGATTLDKTTSGVHATAVTTFTLTSGTLANANELIFGCSNGTTGYSTWAESAGFRQFLIPPTAVNIYCSYRVVAATTSISWIPSFTPSQTTTEVLATW